jgi:CDP-paratose 2-epimerase
LLIEEYRSKFGLRAVINRCGVVAGPWQFGKVDQGVTALWIIAHHLGTPLTYIGYGGEGKQVRDILHVDDVCDLVVEQLNALESWDGWCGNVAGGQAISSSLKELTTLCEKITGRTIKISSNPTNRAEDMRIFIADCSVLFARTNWRPRRNMETIVSDISGWVQEHKQALMKLASS